MDLNHRPLPYQGETADSATCANRRAQGPSTAQVCGTRWSRLPPGDAATRLLPDVQPISTADLTAEHEHRYRLVMRFSASRPRATPSIARARRPLEHGFPPRIAVARCRVQVDLGDPRLVHLVHAHGLTDALAVACRSGAIRSTAPSPLSVFIRTHIEPNPAAILFGA